MFRSTMIVLSVMVGGVLFPACGEDESKPPGGGSSAGGEGEGEPDGEGEGEGGGESVGDAPRLCSTGCAREIECGSQITQRECEESCLYRATVMQSEAFTTWSQCRGATSCDVLPVNPGEEDAHDLAGYCHRQLACRQEEGFSERVVEEVCPHYAQICEITLAECTQRLAFNGCVASDAATAMVMCLDAASPVDNSCFVGVIRSSPGCGGGGGGGGGG